MKPINLYIHSRIKNTSNFNSVHRHVSRKPVKHYTKEHEIESLKRLVDLLVDKGVCVDEFDAFFHGYQIPRIGKEFDLLKFKKGSVLNIELKSQHVPEEQIAEQLLRNRYYLSHLGKNNFFYTVETSSMTIYKLCGDVLQVIDIDEIVRRVKDFSDDYIEDISNLFRESDYLVSPFQTPDKFINGEYFLTGAQEQIRNKILDHVTRSSEKGFFSIKGMPGTGKTLLLYDTAKKLSKIGNTLIIHLGHLGSSKDALCKIQNFCLCDDENIERIFSEIEQYKFVLVDEAQNMDKECFKRLYDAVKLNEMVCIFSTHPNEILTKSVKQLGSVECIRSVSNLGEYELSEKIRSNKDIYAFISVMKNLTRMDDFVTDYSDVEIAFASDENEAFQICSYYKNKGYAFINYGRNCTSDKITSLEESFDPAHLIGSEFEKAVMLVDSSFYYDFSGRLEGIPTFDPDKLYPNPFYSSITRIRDKFALVVLGDEILFSKISSIIGNK